MGRPCYQGYEGFYFFLQKRIREARLRANLSQGDIANLMGLDRSSVTAWETKLQAPIPHRLWELSILTDTPLIEFFPQSPEEVEECRAEWEATTGKPSVPYQKPQTVDPAFLKAFGLNLEKTRKALGLTQKALAERSNMPAETIKRWEHGQNNPTIFTLCRVAKELGVKVSELLPEDW